MRTQPLDPFDHLPVEAMQARAEAFAVRTDLAALLVEEGRFVQGPNGLTVYVQQIEQNGLLKNLFVYLDRQTGS